jgi:hypothetical protein
LPEAVSCSQKIHHFVNGLALVMPVRRQNDESIDPAMLANSEWERNELFAFYEILPYIAHSTSHSVDAYRMRTNHRNAKWPG